AQDLTRQRGEPVQFLNFAQTGAGLANWWSIVTRMLEPQNYELDGIVFAVWETDLRRPFTMWTMPHKDEPGACMLFGRTTSWDPTTLPPTLDQARPFLKDEERYVLPREEFESALQGRWPASVPRHFQLVLANKVWHFLRTRLHLTPPAASEDDKQGRDRLTAD